MIVLSLLSLVLGMGLGIGQPLSITTTIQSLITGAFLIYGSSKTKI